MTLSETNVKGVDFSNPMFHADRARSLRVALIHTRWNKLAVQSLVKGCLQVLDEYGVQVTVFQVPGSYELPFACQRLLKQHPNQIDAIIPIGVLIKGETAHFEYIAEAVSKGLMQVGLDSGIPVIFGVLTCLNEQQALERAGLTEHGHNHGEDWAMAAIEMALFPHTTQ